MQEKDIKLLKMAKNKSRQWCNVCGKSTTQTKLHKHTGVLQEYKCDVSGSINETIQGFNSNLM